MESTYGSASSNFTSNIADGNNYISATLADIWGNTLALCSLSVLPEAM